MTVSSVRRAVAGAVASAAIIAASVLGGALPASAAVVDAYDTIVDPPETASLAYQTWGVTEYGSTVELAPGTDRSLYEIEIVLVSWACEQGFYWIPDQPCLTTTPGASFAHPITVNLYEDNGPEAGPTLIATVTDQVDVPFRPSFSPDCPSTNPAQQFMDEEGVCRSGQHFTWVFDFSALALTVPDRFSIGVTYNTSTTGDAPIGSDPIPGTNKGYDVLNVGLYGVNPPTVGAFVDQNVWATVAGGNVRNIYADWAGPAYSLQATVRVGAPDPAPEPEPGLAASGSADPAPAIIGAGLLALLGAIVLIGVQRRRAGERA